MTKKNNREQQAAALGYDLEKDSAPKILAKGKGDIAEKILKKAEENNIPIQTDKDLVKTLLALEIGQEIPVDLYQVVAEILAFIYSLEEEN
ncbi:EscU/YscU/HrcU family type III secretion system export apparatus switch protein [Halanaerobiaceae bacterium Z-7014]|uniref:EscU/YscU/HrcU family type III secretion system export apparatus switch protein n=1 Tax=Halonatronomonas betaini TaxID=2778430 RepID=A0A931ATY7_9FIRM|nr:EscU/YscU/HrcU family type III secretion system export apparatus switch protein [Halonatronomonas betaini]MBF8438139.1 EscU/YscU/HrcU family type III secretion system export apparatus switch protein [Halonatronomonas betaini]